MYTAKAREYTEGNFVEGKDAEGNFAKGKCTEDGKYAKVNSPRRASALRRLASRQANRTPRTEIFPRTTPGHRRTRPGVRAPNTELP